MARKRAGIEPGALGICLDNIRHGSVGKPRIPHRARLVDRPEDWASLDTCRVKPRPERLRRAGNVTASNGYCCALRGENPKFSRPPWNVRCGVPVTRAPTN